MTGEPASLGLYVHIPFCQHKCSYCDFNSYSGLSGLYEPYVDGLVREISHAARLCPEYPLSSVYIGGGTPTVLPCRLLARIARACAQSFSLETTAEITCEANPATVDEAGLTALLEIGVSRLSLGVQSFDDAELRLLGRAHSADEATASLLAARRSGFANLSLDLIYGLPGQGLPTWRRTLEQALSICPEHLSLYALHLSPSTSMGQQVAAGHLPAPDDDMAADLYEFASGALEQAGYVQYEISNWARETSSTDGSHSIASCRHNVNYWRNGLYLGVGAGAHSSFCGRRWWNVDSPSEYIDRVRTERSPVADEEQIDAASGMAETVILGLRMVREGVAFDVFERRFGRSLLATYPDIISSLVSDGLLEQLPDRIRLSCRGRLLGNEAFARFLPA